MCLNYKPRNHVHALVYSKPPHLTRFLMKRVWYILITDNKFYFLFSATFLFLSIACA